MRTFGAKQEVFNAITATVTARAVCGVVHEVGTQRGFIAGYVRAERLKWLPRGYAGRARGLADVRRALMYEPAK